MSHAPHPPRENNADPKGKTVRTEVNPAPNQSSDPSGKLEQLFDWIPQLLCLADREGRIIKVNREWKEALGYEPAELEGHLAFEFIHPEDLPAAREALKKGRSGGKKEDWAIRFRTREGEFRWLECRAFFKDERIYAAARDLTEQKKDQKAIEDSERRLAQIIDFLPDATFVIDREGRVVAWNRAVEKMTGVPAKDMIGQGDLAHSLAFYNERRPVLIDLVITPDPATEEKYVYVKRQGDLLMSETNPDRVRFGDVYLSNRASPLYDSDGQVAGAVESIRDITDRKQMEDALRESEEKYRLLVENAGEAIFVAQDGSIKFLNAKTGEMIRQSREELLSKSFIEFIHPEDRALVLKRHQARQRGLSQPSQYTFRIITGTAEERWVELNVVLIDWEGRPATLNFLSDITERKQTEDALRENDLFLKETQRIARLGGWKANPFTDYLEWNEGIYEILEADPHYRPGLSEGLQFFLPEFIPVIQKKLLECWSTGQPYSMECRVRTASGRTLWAEIRFISPIKEQGRHFVMGTLQDITERRSAEEEKEKLQAQFLQAQKMESIGRLAGGVAHDFNNMLSIIIGRTELGILKLDPHSSLRQDLEEIEKAALRSADVVRQLLAFARRQTVETRVLDLNETLTGILQMLERLIGEDVSLIWQPAKTLWPVKLDPSQVNQIMVNLTVNARDAIAGAGRIIIKTDNVFLDEGFCAYHLGCIPGSYVHAAVIDTGEGMPPQVLQHLFEPFFTTKEVGKGTGLGLSTVYGIVKQNNGFIYVSSRPGAGTTVDLYFPRLLEAPSPPSGQDLEGNPSAGSETLLLIEDEGSILTLVQSMLKMLGYRVLTAKSPTEAIRIAENMGAAIHLIITDVIMPEMNGKALADRLRLMHPGLKCLFMSGYTADMIAHWGVLEEGVHFIQKPFGLKDLGAMVRKVLDQDG
jgi:two-component system, cell cycle sensor histidine kinase and response regulator CckA